MIIFSRWGSKVFQQKAYKNKWGGTFGDKDLPSGTYFYKLNLNDREGKMYSGFVHIRR